MSVIWSNKTDGIVSAFLSRAQEEQGYHIRSVANAKNRSDQIRALENNRTTISEYLRRPDLMLSMGTQVHGTQVAYTGKPEIIADTDGLVTDRNQLAIAVLVADCAAVLLADPVHRVVSAVHAGWRGAVQGITEQAVSNMIKVGAEPDMIKAYLSPCISQSRFEVGEEVASLFKEQFVDYNGPKPRVDLQKFVFQKLVDSGVSSDRIQVDQRCTYTENRSLHSYRRDGEDSGRMMAVIALADS